MSWFHRHEWSEWARFNARERGVKGVNGYVLLERCESCERGRARFVCSLGDESVDYDWARAELEKAKVKGTVHLSPTRLVYGKDMVSDCIAMPEDLERMVG